MTDEEPQSFYWECTEYPSADSTEEEVVAIYKEDDIVNMRSTK
jgi:hypothetical protein